MKEFIEYKSLMSSFYVLCSILHSNWLTFIQIILFVIFFYYIKYQISAKYILIESFESYLMYIQLQDYRLQLTILISKFDLLLVITTNAFKHLKILLNRLQMKLKTYKGN